MRRFIGHLFNGRKRMRVSLKLKFALFLLLACITLAVPNMTAQQKGQYMPGQFGLNAGIIANPGFTYVDMNLNYSSDRFNDRNGNAAAVTGNYNVWAVENQLFYVPKFTFLGGHYAVGTIITLANGNLAVPTYGVNGGGAGLADTWIQPFTVGWHAKRADVFVGDAIMVPTGRYRLGASDNIGSGYLGNHLVTGTTLYLTKNHGTSANLFTDWEAHGHKSGTNFTPGQAFTTEWGFGQVLPLKKDMSRLLQVGGVGYDQWQVSQNKGPAEAAVATTLGMYSVHSAGVQANFIAPPKGLNVFFKYYWEYKAYSHSLGNTVSFGFNWTLRDPKPAKP